MDFRKMTPGASGTLNGFTIDVEEGNDLDQRMYMVYTPDGKQWALPEGAPHCCMEWTPAGVRRITSAELIDCPAGCECCWDDEG